MLITECDRGVVRSEPGVTAAADNEEVRGVRGVPERVEASTGVDVGKVDGGGETESEVEIGIESS